jgi:hypothetical protein
MIKRLSEIFKKAGRAVSNDLWVLVEGPGPDDAEFLGRWLLAAAAADRALQEQFKRNPTLRKQISSLEVCYEIRFSAAATRFLALLMENLTAFTLSIEENWIDPFSIMADLGFFRLTGERYQMTVPPNIPGSAIEVALLKLAATERNFSMHPEHLIHFVTRTYAQTWRARLEKLPWMQRVADRNILLDVAGLGS